MHTGCEIPNVFIDSSLSDTLIEMTSKALGMVAISDKKNKLVGIFTDGDLRRIFDRNIDIHNTNIGELMSADCITVHPNLLAAEALKIMQLEKINALLVEDENQNLVGALNMHAYCEQESSDNSKLNFY